MQRLQGTTKLFWGSMTPVPQYAFATMSLKVLKIRMKSVASIRKITKAMKMVAASKMRMDVQRLDLGKHFGIKSVQEMLANETYLQKRNPTIKVNKTLIVPMTSDKGLCGGVNSSIIRDVRNTIKLNRSGYKMFLIGEKVFIVSIIVIQCTCQTIP